MSTRPGDYLGGIRTLADVRDRCYVDPETGCWHWRLHISTRGRSCCVWRVGSVEFKGTAARAAWALSGRPLEPGWIVSRWRGRCEYEDCCNPEHHRAGPKPNVLPKLRPEQRLRHKLGVTRESRKRAKLTMEAARQIRLSPDSCVAEAAKWGVAFSTVSQIRRGETWKENPLA